MPSSSRWKSFSRTDQELNTLAEMGREDEGFIPELRSELARAEPALADLELKSLLSGPHDANAAIMTINARDGGTDANDWAEMLLRMYIQWAQKNGYTIELLDRQDDGVAGIQSAAIIDPRADGLWLSQRRDRHAPAGADQPVQRRRKAADQFRRRRRFARNRRGRRNRNPRRGHSRRRVSRQRRRRPARQQDLQRHPPDASADGHRRAVPERAQPAQESGHGLSRCSARAWRGSKKKNARPSRRAKYKGKAKTGFGSQIRNYFLHPDQRVKDQRTGYYVGNFQSVLDGNIQGFLDAYLRWRVTGESPASRRRETTELIE